MKHQKLSVPLSKSIWYSIKICGCVTKNEKSYECVHVRQKQVKIHTKKKKKKKKKKFPILYGLTR